MTPTGGCVRMKHVIFVVEGRMHVVEALALTIQA